MRFISKVTTLRNEYSRSANLKWGAIVNFHIAIGKTTVVVVGIGNKELPKVDIKTPFHLRIFARELT